MHTLSYIHDTIVDCLTSATDAAHRVFSFRGSFEPFDDELELPAINVRMGADQEDDEQGSSMRHYNGRVDVPIDIAVTGQRDRLYAELSEIRRQVDLVMYALRSVTDARVCAIRREGADAPTVNTEASKSGATQTLNYVVWFAHDHDDPTTLS